jgi:hypothetical protein
MLAIEFYSLLHIFIASAYKYRKHDYYVDYVKLFIFIVIELSKHIDSWMFTLHVYVYESENENKNWLSHRIWRYICILINFPSLSYSRSN